MRFDGIVSRARRVGLCALVGLVVPLGARAEAPVRRNWGDGWSTIERMMRAKAPSKYIAQSVRPDMYPVPGDRDPVDVVLRRAEGLLDAVAANPGARSVARHREALARLRADAKLARLAGEKLDRDVYARVRELHWRITLDSGLLDFDRIVFIRRNKSRRGHMCDQFLGRNANPGGGLYILSGAFTGRPTLTDVLADSAVVNGRLKGRKLAGGAFLSPSLSYDGRSIVFAYCECGKSSNRDRPGWDLETCFHLFRVNVDGSGLFQITDGRLNDFHPCWLPNGRIAFISERRGGYGRCHGGRDAPSYTLCSVNPDGGDLVYLSYHESNEWHPSVTNDGQIVYTRWDYVDRGTNQAHHPWITSLDGRDARAVHGNYPPTRQALHGRPWMEMHIRAIPGSNKYVATAAAHHGQAYGSLVILDPDVEDDDGMSQLRRLTPEAGFPEAERGGGDFATAWPLSEDVFLCAWRGGLYVIDSFGERTLLYKGSGPGCLNPIPLRPRPAPLLVPHLTAVGLPPGAARRPPGADGSARPPDPPATIALMNVYDALMPWPEGTKITALRIVQILPKAAPRAPDCGTGRTNIRQVVGTVPVEADGSAYFLAPTDLGIHFQALDERGLAVQSMRSLTYVHPGQRLVCQGCHERRWRAPAVPKRVPLALRRPPSPVRPDVSGSNPWDARQLVSPVLEDRCEGCHREKARKVRLDARTLRRYVPTYISPKPFEPSRTVPGSFGALGSKFLKYLDASHHGVKLTDEEFHRITLWMDLNLATNGPDRIAGKDRARLAEFQGRESSGK